MEHVTVKQINSPFYILEDSLNAMMSNRIEIDAQQAVLHLLK